MVFQILDKVRKELHEATGGQRDLSLQDKANTPYFVATLHVSCSS